MTGVREMSIIATPPVDRLAVRTFVSPFDALIVREALLARALSRRPELSTSARASRTSTRRRPSCARTFRKRNSSSPHGQMAARELEDKIGAFYDGKYDILLSTAIVESGLDIPRANTLIVHRADMFGLAQLYQLRGRVGRSKLRAYAHLHHAGEGQDHAAGGEAAAGAAVARHARRRLPAREPRPRPARRRQSARRGAVRPHQGGRLRALPADGARGGRAHQVGRGRAGRGHVVADDPARRAGDDPREPIFPTCRRGSRSTAASPRSRTRPRSTRWGPRSSTASARRRRRSAC